MMQTFSLLLAPGYEAYHSQHDSVVRPPAARVLETAQANRRNSSNSESSTLNWQRSLRPQNLDDIETVGPFCTEVFLGGSCNPTQWRRDEAIPALKEAQVTYYNPQRSDWRPELIELEQQAKENARVLLFVHDKETRSLASMVEVGEMSARKKPLVLAIEDQGRKVAGESLSDRELQEMQRARNYMRGIAEACHVRVHTEIQAAVQSCIAFVKGNVKATTDENAPIFDKTLGEKFIKVHSAFDNHSTNDRLSSIELQMAFRVSSGRDLPKELSGSEKDQITLDQYCMINAEYRMSAKPCLLKMLRMAWPSEKLPSNRESAQVFIGGPVGEENWRTAVAVPHFKKEHVTFRQRDDDNSKHFLPMEMQQIESCKVLLFVFPSDAWGAAEMIMASYYIGLGEFKVVLCIQDISGGSQIHGHRVSRTQAKDYNRGRSYLADQATRTRVPVYSDVAEAVAKAAELARE